MTETKFPCITEPDGYPYEIDESEVGIYRAQGYEVCYVSQTEYDEWMQRMLDCFTNRAD